MSKKLTGFTLISLLLLRKRSCQGFTLIELLIVVAIISLLMTIAISSFSSLQENTRDARRQSDLKVVQSALEQYHADQGYYPTSSDFSFSSDSLSAGNRTYLKKVPNDPTDAATTPYVYKGLPDSCTGTSCTKYCLYSKMENPDNEEKLTDCQDQSSTSYIYEVTSP